MFVVLLRNQLVKITLRVLGKANGEGWMVVKRWVCCEEGVGVQRLFFFPKELAGFRLPSEIPPQLLY